MSTTDPPTDQDRAREVSRALHIFQENFTTYLATTISIAEAIPDEVNNQLRNMLTHLARANMATDMATLNREIGSALAHLERANRDCLKVSIIYEHDRLNDAIANVVFYRGALTPSIRASFNELKRVRRDAYKQETRGDDRHTKTLESILTQTMSISEEIAEHYGEAGRRATSILRFLKRHSRPWMILVALIVGAIVRPYAGALFESSLHYLIGTK